MATTIPAPRTPATAPTHDPRLKHLQWRDLVHLQWWEKTWELTLPIPWLILSLYFYSHNLWLIGVPCSFFFFLTGLRLSHNAQHNCLGIPRRAHDLALFIIAALMLSSGHAVQATHLHHHRHCLEEEDTEAWPARLPGWKVILLGPLFPYTLHRSAWKLATPTKRRWIAAELTAIAILITAALTIPHFLFLRWHLAAMLAGEWLVGFFAVWTVHRGCDPHDHHSPRIARTQRGLLKNLMTYSMLYHIEHHLFPAIPTCHLPELAQRLDAAAPELNEFQVY